MSTPRARPLAWGLAALVMALEIGGRVVYSTTDAFELVAFDLLFSALTVAFAIVGMLVASRHPRNAIGWIFLSVAVSLALDSLAQGYVEYRLQTDTDPSGLAGAAAAYLNVAWVAYVTVPATFLLLLFPDGCLPSRRWRPIAWCAGAAIVGLIVTVGTTAESFDYPTVQNPFAIHSAVMDTLSLLSQLLIFGAILGSAGSIVARFRRAGHVQRQQIKWLAIAGGILAVTIPIDVALEDVLGDSASYLATSLSLLGLPAAVGIAILRHRLYDIDVVINRALVYGALTATLAGAYLGSVLLLQLALTGITEGSGPAVAVSTLGVAALFRPARGRIQEAVDRRFYRRKYDAQRTLEAFSSRLRDEVNLGALNAELGAVVRETLQPAHVSLWLRAPEGRQ